WTAGSTGGSPWNHGPANPAASRSWRGRARTRSSGRLRHRTVSRRTVSHPQVLHLPPPRIIGDGDGHLALVPPGRGHPQLLVRRGGGVHVEVQQATAVAALRPHAFPVALE